MDIDWYKCQGDIWCELYKLDLNHKYLSGLAGVFIIWSGKTERTVLRVGYGDIAKELQKYSKDITIHAFQHHGVYATWAEVSMMKRKNVCSFLSKKLAPKFNDNVPDASPQEVELPWD